MKILAMDDEELCLKFLERMLKSILPDAEIVSFRNPKDLFTYEDKSSFDIAFLDICMGQISGLQVAMELKNIAPLCNIIFVTGYPEYGVDAFQTRASGYIMKPYTEKDISNELKNLRHAIPELNNGKLRIRTFGNFEVFHANGKPFHFSRNLCKEIFAYIVDAQGFPVTSKDIAEDVLEISTFDRKIAKQISNRISELMNDLRNAGYENVLIKQSRTICIDKNAVDCDIYRMLSGEPSAINAYRGEYLKEYGWSRFSDAVRGMME